MVRTTLHIASTALRPGVRLTVYLSASVVISAVLAALLVSQATAQPPEPEDPLELYDANDNGIIDSVEAIRATADYLDGLIDGALAYRVWLLYKSKVVMGQAWTTACSDYDEDGTGVIERGEVIQAIRDYFNDLITRAKVLLVMNCYYSASHSIEISGLLGTLQEGGSDGFTVRASNLLQSNSYTINVTTDNSNIGFDSNCSVTPTPIPVTVSSDKSNFSSELTLYACSAPGGAVTAKLSMGDVGDLAYYSKRVTVTRPSPPPSRPLPPPPPPTPVKPVSFGSETITDMRYQAGESVSKELPAATGGIGDLTYAVSPAMGNGLTFNSSTRTVGGIPTAAAESVIYRYTAKDRNGNMAQLTFTVTVFNVEVIVGNGGLKDGRWNVWTAAPGVVDVSISRADGYQFRIGIPASAGFQFSGSACTWPAAAPTSTATLRSRWVLQNGRFNLIRCGIGAGTSARVEVWVKLEERGTPSLLYAKDVTIPQSWHAGDNRIDYYVKGTGSNPSATRVSGVEQGGTEGMFPAKRPPNLSPDYAPNEELLKLFNYDEAAKVWNIAVVGATIRRVNSVTNADVLIEGYWEPGEKSDKCGGTIACYMKWGPYPHIGSQTLLLIEDPPRWPRDYEMGSVPMREWTINVSEYRKRPDKYAYLPGVVMHEFGHAIGLWHGGTNSVMVGHLYLRALSPDDTNAARAIYRRHSAHENGSP